MRITPLASGSQGNSLLLEGGGVRVLVDAGLRVDALEERLAQIGMRGKDVDHLFVTHRHGDHVRGATEFARRHRVRVWTTRRTARCLGTEVHRRLWRVEFGRAFALGELLVRAVALPHDAPETAGLVVEHGGLRFGYATDLGSVTAGVVDALGRCDALFLEANHDPAMLTNGDDPPFLKRRIASDVGHLSNEQTADLLARLPRGRLRHVVLAHLSARNNRPELAIAAVRRVLDEAVAVRVARQDEPTEPVVVTPLADGAAALVS